MRIQPGRFKLYGVIGYPLQHTLSPRMQQAAFEHLGLPHFYAALELTLKSFKQMMHRKKKLLLDGFNLTIPYKQAIIPYLDLVSPEARLIKAVNTVIVKRGRLLGENTDAYGFLKSIKEKFGWNSKGKSILIIGAGGAARACIYDLGKEGASIIFIMNRTLSKAKRLYDEFGKKFSKTQFSFHDLKPKEMLENHPEIILVVNTTSLGFRSDDPKLIHKFPRANGKRFAVDLIYNPPQTEFLRLAKAAGWKTANGLGMLLYQGAKA
ncbi:MAG: shikimate dehydrogenase, partial [Candidatus Omnitrophica bacterium]|nr:shikimate dehydrogenase [Candidatus Omnitrophota bacterium]